MSQKRSITKAIAWLWADKVILRHLRGACRENGTNPRAQLHVYLALCEIASNRQSESFYATIDEIGNQCGYGRRTVEKALIQLREIRVVEVSETEKWGPNKYCLIDASHLAAKYASKKNAKNAHLRRGNKKVSKKNEETNDKKKQENAVVEYSSEFKSFWQAYPDRRREQKGEAWQAWLDLDPNEELRTKILNSLKAWTSTKKYRDTETKFLPLPVNWLRKARWEDEFPERSNDAEYGSDYEPAGGWDQ